MMPFTPNSRFGRRITILAAIVGCAVMSSSSAHASGSSMPWETPLNQILESIQGPVAKIISVIIITVTGLTLAFGDTSGALLAAFDAQQKRWDDAAAALGFDAVDAELRAALGKERDFVASVPKTKAANLPGVAAKLAILIQLGEPSPTDAEFPWPELRSALADVARLASPEAAVSPM